MVFCKKKWSKKSLRLLGLAANGVAEAQYDLALLLLDGKGVPKNTKLAIDWLIKSAAQENEDANFMLYTFYSNGTVVTKNNKIALGFLMRAAEGTNKYAQFELGDYCVGKSNHAEAFEWYRKSARQEYAPAQCEVGRCFYYGIGTFQSDELAKEWFDRAATKNYKQAQDFLNTLSFGVKS